MRSRWGAWVGVVVALAGGCSALVGLDKDYHLLGGGGAGGGGAGGAQACTPGADSPCYDGPMSTEGKGICVAGIHTCNPDGITFGPCIGAVVPTAEDCAKIGDENCDGTACSEVIWQGAYGDVAGASPNSITADGTGNVLVVGSFGGSLKFGASAPALASAGNEDIFVAKLDSAGNHLWSKRFGDANNQSAEGVAVDAMGNVFVAGDFNGTLDFGVGTPLQANGYITAFLVKFDPMGNVLWSRAYSGAQSYRFRSVTVDGSGDAITTGYIQTLGPNNQDLMIVKYNSTGNLSWSKVISAPGNQRGHAIAADSAKSIFVTGTYDGSFMLGATTLSPAGGDDMFLTKLDAAGTVAWAKGFGDAAYQGGTSVAVDSLQNVLVTGFNGGSVTFGPQAPTLTSAGKNDVFLAKFNPSGLHLWSKQYGDGAVQEGLGVAVDKNDNVLFTGWTAGTINFGGGPLVSAGSNDIFLAKLDGTGNHLWSKRFGDGADQFGEGVAAGPTGQVFLSAWASGMIDFGKGAIDAGGTKVIVLASFQP